MPETPSASASAANRTTVSVIASRAPDERRVLREVVREPRARELPRERERREERGQDRRVADTPVEAHPHDGLELLDPARRRARIERADRLPVLGRTDGDRKSTRLNSSHGYISYAVFCLKKKKHHPRATREHWERG